MFESARHVFFIAALAILAMGTAGARDAAEDSPRGQHGGEMELLRSFHTPPSTSEESNHYVDMWVPGSLVAFARVQGLTNNHALFIDSHGTEQFSWKGPKYVLRPNSAAIGAGRRVPTYSIGDVARVMGPEAAGRIHNVVIAGCNEGGSLRPAEFRRYFVNATNITYMVAGQLSYKPVFYQALTEHSEDIKPLYGKRVASEGQRVMAQIYRTPVEESFPLGNYVADLFEPGATKPYRRQLAGRELLEPGFPRTPGLRADGTVLFGEP